MSDPVGAVERRLAELGLVLPEPMPAVANYVPAKRSGPYLFVAGHGPMENGVARYTGRVGAGVTVQEAQAAAALTMLNILATVRAELGDLDRIEGFERVFVMVASAPDFHEHHLVADGASDLLAQVLPGDRGRHARAAVGMISLPFDIAVEIEATVRVNG